MHSVFSVCLLSVGLLLAGPLSLAAQPPTNEALPSPPPARYERPGTRIEVGPLPAGWQVVPARLQSGQLPSEPDDEFVPISELPPEERLPAAPMLVAAYAFVVLALFGYMLSLSRRVSAVGREIARLEDQVKRGQRS